MGFTLEEFGFIPKEFRERQRILQGVSYKN